MDLFLKSTLSKRDEDTVQMPKVLLLYQDRGFVNSTMELMRKAAGKVSAATSVPCTIWDFDFVAQPLLMRAAAREACAADMVILVFRVSNTLPRSVKGWLRLWMLAHPWAFLGREGFGSNGECFDSAPASIDSQMENVGQLGNMAILAVGGNKAPALATFKKEMLALLVGGTHQPLSVARRGVSSAHTTDREGLWSHSAAV